MDDVEDDKNILKNVRITCDICSQTLKPELTLEQHKNIRHSNLIGGNPLRVICPPILKRSLIEGKDQVTHMKRIHQCKKCSYFSNNSSNLIRHVEVNTLFFLIFHFKSNQSPNYLYECRLQTKLKGQLKISL